LLHPDAFEPRGNDRGAASPQLFDHWFDPIETAVRGRAREFIEELIRGELYGRGQMAGNEARATATGHRHGSRARSLTGTFGPIEIAVPRAGAQRTIVAISIVQAPSIETPLPQSKPLLRSQTSIFDMARLVPTFRPE
jgi:hypothetical protein